MSREKNKFETRLSMFKKIRGNRLWTSTWAATKKLIADKDLMDPICECKH